MLKKLCLRLRPRLRLRLRRLLVPFVSAFSRRSPLGSFGPRRTVTWSTPSGLTPLLRPLDGPDVCIPSSRLFLPLPPLPLSAPRLRLRLLLRLRLRLRLHLRLRLRLCFPPAPAPAFLPVPAKKLLLLRS
jgi:hypothetical protein